MPEQPSTSTLTLSDGQVTTFEVHPELASTNATLRDRFVDDNESFAPYFAIATTAQTAGKGRLDREWTCPPGRALALTIYVELDAEVARNTIGWVSLAAGLAVRDTVNATINASNSRSLASDLTVKWPNDVLLGSEKLAGVLSEFLGVVDGGRAFACAVGIGVNTGLEPADLPTDTATSLAIHGLDVDPLTLAPHIVRALASRLDALVAARGDADASGLRAELDDHCATFGSEVRVTLGLPTDPETAPAAPIEGIAVGVDAVGQLLISTPDGTVEAVSAGDVEHVRTTDGGLR